MDLMNQADASGQIDIDGAVWPVSYRVIADGETGGGRNVHVEISLPRDWLIERGFKSTARLIREGAEDLHVRPMEPVSTDAPITVMLQSEPSSTASPADVARQFPELRMQ